MKTTFIYALVDPKGYGNHIYVGKSDNPYRRFRRHLFVRKERSQSHKVHWLQLLLKAKLKPDLQILEQCPENIWKEREINWIAFYKKCNYTVVNQTDGGDYNHCLPHSEKTKKQMSKSHTGLPSNMKGKHHSIISKNKIRKARLGQHLKITTKKKLIKILKKRHHDQNQVIKEKILQSKINFTKWGWQKRVAEEMGLTHVSRWMERNMSEFYKSKCRNCCPCSTTG